MILTIIKFLFALPFSYRQWRLAKSRPPMDKEQFVSRISAEGGDEQAAAMIWDTLVSGWVNEGFTPYPDDSFERVYGIVDEDLVEDFVIHTLTELGIPVPDSDFAYRFGPVDTSIRIAQFVSACRRINQ